MDFTGKICPYCKTEFKEDDDVVVCSICEMPHHKDCWIENKACTTFGCTGTIAGAEQYKEESKNKSFCSKCGAVMEEGQKFCAACGTAAGSTGEPRFQPAGAFNVNQSYQQSAYAQSQTQYNPQYSSSQFNTQYTVPNFNSQYSSNQYNAGFNPYDKYQQFDQDFHTFLQRNQQYYVMKFQDMQMRNSTTSWNWCSFLFGTYWFAYRKLYGIAAAFVGASWILALIPGIGTLLSFATSVCAGIFGNHLYKQYMERELQIAKNMDPINKNMYITKKGGTSAGAVWILIGIAFIIGMMLGDSM